MEDGRQPRRLVAWLAIGALSIALLGGVVFLGDFSGREPTGKQLATVTLPPEPSMKEIKHAQVKVFDPGTQPVELQAQYLQMIVAVYNTEPKQVRPRDIGTTPDFTVEILLTSGKMLSLGMVKDQPIMAAFDGASFWIDSEG